MRDAIDATAESDEYDEEDEGASSRPCNAAVIARPTLLFVL